MQNNYKLIFIALLSFTLLQSAVGQNGVWKTLGQLTYKKEMDEFLGFKIDKPVFGEPVKALEGKEITIRGYIIPVEGYKDQTEFVFSAYPYSMCFFCGGAGPETVMEVEARESVEYTADPVTLKGTLHLNADDINALMYKLTDARQVSGED
ncbi:MAG: DUF3299 domain-containing protein [Bacteroidetes bacterium]|nr:DUF3299 domain-containing protein [Bacteroidota bacterium]